MIVAPRIAQLLSAGQLSLILKFLARRNKAQNVRVKSSEDRGILFNNPPEMVFDSMYQQRRREVKSEGSEN